MAADVEVLPGSTGGEVAAREGVRGGNGQIGDHRWDSRMRRVGGGGCVAVVVRLVPRLDIFRICSGLIVVERILR